MKVEIQGATEGLAYIQVCVTLVRLLSPLNRGFFILKTRTVITFVLLRA